MCLVHCWISQVSLASEVFGVFPRSQLSLWCYWEMSLNLPQAGERRLWILPQKWGWLCSPFVLAQCRPSQCLLDRPAGHHLGPECGGGREQVTRCGSSPPPGDPLGHAESLTLAGSGQKMLVAAPNVAPPLSFGYFHWVRRKKPREFWLRVFAADSRDTV